MVCCFNATVANNKEAERSAISPIKKEADNMDEATNDDDLKLKRLAGGRTVDYPPLFSPDGENLFVISGNHVEVYSTTTGEFLRNLEGLQDDIIALQYELTNDKYLIACSKTGEIVKWKWKSAALENQVQIHIAKNCNIHTFNTMTISSSLDGALITYSSQSSKIMCMIVDISTGKKINCPINLDLKREPAVVTMETKYFQYFAIAQNMNLFIVNYKNWTVNSATNGRLIPFTCIQAHPTEEMIATGDELGRIFLWRQLWSKEKIISSLYHWHHTPVTSIAFTTIGSNFYSSGHEAVLVKWNMERPDLRQYLPRMSSLILHIRVNHDNRKVAVCIADNGIQILGTQNTQICVLQNFTSVFEKKTRLDKFPVGLQLNPRTNCLVLNGRTGYLQFFSTYTKSLLYNMDIVMQNPLSWEVNKILYDIRITHAAFNVDWMVTGEVWDDQEHIPELRLKFWQYKKENQSYSLNTNIELPHEGGFRAIEFSNQYESDNLLCATVGHDNNIKIWALDDSDNIYQKGKIWFCIEQTNYKDMPIESINFSQDGSLLAAGFGNNLCIYKSENLKIKSILTAPGGLDGTLQKVQITIPNKIANNNSENVQVQRNETKEKHQRILQLFKDLIENNEGDLICKINRNKMNSTKVVKKSSSILPKLNNKQKMVLFRKIQSTTELNLFQKLKLYQKLKIFCSVPMESTVRLFKYIHGNIFNTKRDENNLHKSVSALFKRNKFKAKYKLHRYTSRKLHYISEINEQLIPLMDLLNLNAPYDEDRVMCNGLADRSECNSSINEMSKCDDDTDILPPLQNVASIRSVHFATGEFAHLVVVCTEYRVLVWNLLTLRLQCVLKLSVRKMVVDPMTSLFAAFTTNNELYIFLPNAPMVIYRRTNLPVVHGACWVPRTYPKSQSINIDWQSISTLFFLSDKQELLYLASDSDVDIFTSAPSFLSEPQETLQYSTFGAFAIKQINAKSKLSNSTALSIGIPGKAATKRLIDMSTHAMAPVNLLCNDFIKSLLNVEKEQVGERKKEDNLITISEENDSDDEVVELNKNQRSRKFLETHTASTGLQISSYIQQEQELQKILKEKIVLNFT